mmetsp:Transcript_28938/g.53736  ORF Transcript_28938/g.53736 Transcript_28938/m.53736 type:complete len:190 (-) Transcript_28938:98-667(-)
MKLFSKLPFGAVLFSVVLLAPEASLARTSLESEKSCPSGTECLEFDYTGTDPDSVLDEEVVSKIFKYCMQNHQDTSITPYKEISVVKESAETSGRALYQGKRVRRRLSTCRKCGGSGGCDPGSGVGCRRRLQDKSLMTTSSTSTTPLKDSGAYHDTTAIGKCICEDTNWFMNSTGVVGRVSDCKFKFCG